MGVHPRIMLDIFIISWNWTHLKSVGGNLLALIWIVKNSTKIVSAHIIGDIFFYTCKVFTLSQEQLIPQFSWEWVPMGLLIQKRSLHSASLCSYGWYGHPLFSVWSEELISHFPKHQWTDKYITSWGRKKKAPAAECNVPLTQLWNAARTGSRVGKNVSVVDLSIPKVKRSMYVNKENLKHIFLCSNDSLQTAWLRLLQTTQELFTPEQFQWIKCMNSYDEQLLANFSTIFSQGLTIKPHFCVFKNIIKEALNNKIKVVFSFYTESQQKLAERTLTYIRSGFYSSP